MQKELSLIAVTNGDPSVGIPATTWTIYNLGEIDCFMREVIRDSFAHSFALMAGEPVKIIFSDELPQ